MSDPTSPPSRAGGSVTAVSTAQVLFAIALGSITLLITAFAVYVAGSALWGDRWFTKR